MWIVIIIYKPVEKQFDTNQGTLEIFIEIMNNSTIQSAWVYDRKQNCVTDGRDKIV